MLQVIDYKEDDIVSAGFKKNNFVVYGEVSKAKGKTKKQYLQEIYEQCKSALDYESLLHEEGKSNSMFTDKEGENFIPDKPTPIKIEVDFDKLEGVVLDQYGDIYSLNVNFRIEGTAADIENESVREYEVDEDTKYYIVASYGAIEERQERIIYAPVPDKLKVLENQLLEVQEYLVNKEYEELLKGVGL